MCNKKFVGLTGITVFSLFFFLFIPFTLLAAEGDVKWSLPTGLYSSTAVGDDGTIYLYDGSLRAITPNGTELWSILTGSFHDGYNSVSVDKDGTVIPYSTLIHSIDFHGNIRWTYDASKHNYCGGHLYNVHGGVAIDQDGTVYVGGKGFRAISPEGKEKFQLGQVNDFGGVCYRYTEYGNPVISSNGTVYVLGQYYDDNDSFTGKVALWALNKNGEEIWKYNLSSDFNDYHHTPAIGQDGTIYVAIRNGRVFAVNPDGTVKWICETGMMIGEGSSPVIDADGTLYIATNNPDSNTTPPSTGGTLFAISQEGTINWSYRNDNASFSASPAIGPDGTIFIAHDIGYGLLTALDKNGNLKWILNENTMLSYVISSLPLNRLTITRDGTILLIQRAQDSGAKLYAIEGHSATGTSNTWSMSQGSLKHDGRQATTETVAEFTSKITGGRAPLTIKFTDRSETAPTSWLWDFGDGEHSLEQSPVHTYHSPGLYSVSLTVTSSEGTDTITKENYVFVRPTDIDYSKNYSRFSTTKTTNYIDSNNQLWGWGVCGHAPFIPASNYTCDNSNVHYPPKQLPFCLKTKTVSSYRDNSTVTLCNDGTVYAWADDRVFSDDHDLPVVPAELSGLSNSIDVATSNEYVLAVKDDGTVWGIGTRRSNSGFESATTPQQLPGIEEALSVAIGYQLKDIVVTENGHLKYVGYGWSHAAEDAPVILDKIIAVDQGEEHVVALSADGTVWTWGRDNSLGQLGLGENVLSKLQGYYGNPRRVKGLNNIIAIAAGANHSLALAATGEVWAWGDNSEGQLGNGTTNTQLSPIQISTLPFIQSIGADWQSSFAVAPDGTVYAWGAVYDGGDGYNWYSNHLQPVIIPFPSYNLEIRKAGNGKGTVTSTPYGISCDNNCTESSAEFSNSEAVTLTASASSDSTFTGWSGDSCSGVGPCNLVMDQAHSVIATFSLNEIEKHTLTVVKLGDGTGVVTSTPSGISCDESCTQSSADFNSGTVIQLHATASENSTFVGWSGGRCEGSENCSVTMNEAITIMPIFRINSSDTYSLSIIKAGNGTGSVTSTPVGINCDELCGESNANFPLGEVVTLKATPTSGSSFERWHGCVPSEDNSSCTIEMSSDRTVYATFSQQTQSTQYTLTVNKEGEGDGIITSFPTGIECPYFCDEDSAVFEKGTRVVLHAETPYSFIFTGWTGSECADTQGDCVITMNSDMTITANFSRDTHCLSVWTQHDPTMYGNIYGINFTDIIWTGEKFIALTNRGIKFIDETGQITDEFIAELEPSSSFWSTKSIATNSNNFVVAEGSGSSSDSKGGIYTSSDGKHWTSQYSGEALLDVIWTGNRYVAVGSEGAILTSPDGLLWSKQQSGTSEDLYGITYSGDRFVVVGANTTILTSVDGATWETIPTNLISPHMGLLAVTYGNNLYIAVGGDPDGGVVLTSSDGVIWKKQQSNVAVALWDVALTSGGFIAVGDEGVVITSDNGHDWTRRHSAISGRLYSVASSGDVATAVGFTGGYMVSSSCSVSLPPKSKQFPWVLLYPILSGHVH